MPFSDILAHGFMQETNKKALQVVKSERDQYSLVWKTIEEYCRKHHLIVSNKYVLVDDTNAHTNVYAKNFNIYTSNPFRHANNLCNEIHSKMSKDPNVIYTRMKTLQEKEDFSIEYNMRTVAFIHKLQKHKSLVESNKLVKPVEIDKLLYMPSELELIDIYHTMYNPAMFDGKEEASVYEKLLFERVSKRKEKGILGAGCKELKRQHLQALKVGIVGKWLVSRDFILIGPWAHDWIKHHDDLCASKEKIQILGDINPDKFKDELQKFVHDMTKFSISYREQKLHIPKDDRTTRYTFYVQIQGDRGVTEKPFLDLFNVAQFEVVPCQKVHGMLLGTKEVQLRFLFIDLWVIRVIQGLGYLTKEILQKKLLYLWNMIKFFRNTYEIPGDVQYIGTNKDAFIEKKMNNLKCRSYYPYYPGAYLLSKNKYREI